MNAKSEKTRKRIIEAAITIIARDGIEQTTTREIAAVAGVANGLVSRYIRKRADLFKLVLLEIAAEAYPTIEARQKSQGEAQSAQQNILWMMRANLDFFLDRPNYAKCFVLFFYYATIEPEVRAMNTQLTNRALGRLKEFWQTHVKEIGARQTPERVEACVEILYNQLVAGLIRFYAFEHGMAADSWTSRFLADFEQLIIDLSSR